MASAPADKETAKETTGYWSGYVRRMRGDSSGGGAAPAAPGRLDPPPATVLSPPPAKGSRGLGATAGRHAPSPESASALASAKSAPLRESSGRSSDIYGRPEWDPLFTSTCSFRGRASVSPRPAPAAAAGEHGRAARPGSASLAAAARAAASARAASPGPRPGTAGQRAAARPATQRDRRHSAGHDDCGGGGSAGSSPAAGKRSAHTHTQRELAALAGIYRQQAARAASPGPTTRPGAAHASPGRGGRYASPGPAARFSSPASPPPRGRCSSPTPGRPHARAAAAAAAAAPSALSDPGVDILFAECTSKLQHLEYSALLLLMAAQEAKGRLPDDGEAPVDLPEAEFDREAAKEAWDALKRHQAAAAQRWSLQQSRGGGGSGGGSGGGGSSAAASGGGGGSGGGGPSGGGSGATEASDGGSSHSAAGLLRQRYIGSES